MKIVITDKAMQMLKKHNLGKERFLRVVVTKGGCAGLTYGAEIDQNIQADEKVVFQADDIRIVSNEESLHFMEGLHVDYSDDLINGGLKLTNPSSETTCSCGSSFNLAGFPVKESAGGCGSGI